MIKSCRKLPLKIADNGPFQQNPNITTIKNAICRQTQHFHHLNRSKELPLVNCQIKCLNWLLWNR